MIYEVVEKHRVNTESQVKQLIEEAKQSDQYELKKYTSEFREVKSKGEVIDSWYRVILTKVFCPEKEPISSVSYARYE